MKPAKPFHCAIYTRVSTDQGLIANNFTLLGERS
jgi:hypothetical protein